jgi:hypothetical protein
VTAVFAMKIEVDAQGVAWIGGTKVKVTEIVLDKVAPSTRTASTPKSGEDWKSLTSLRPRLWMRASGGS